MIVEPSSGIRTHDPQLGLAEWLRIYRYGCLDPYTGKNLIPLSWFTNHENYKLLLGRNHDSDSWFLKLSYHYHDSEQPFSWAPNHDHEKRYAHGAPVKTCLAKLVQSIVGCAFTEKLPFFLKKSSLLLPVSCAAVALLSFLLYYSVPAPLISSYSGSAELPVSEKNACNSIQMLTIFHRLLCLAVSFCSFPAVAVARSGSCVPVPAPHWGKILPAPLY